MFYEGLGVLVKESYVSIRLVALLITGLTKLVGGYIQALD